MHSVTKSLFPNESPSSTAGQDFQTAFAQALERIGEITPAEFAARYSPPDRYQEQIGWDPTTAQYAEKFRLDAEALFLMNLRETFTRMKTERHWEPFSQRVKHYLGAHTRHHHERVREELQKAHFPTVEAALAWVQEDRRLQDCFCPTLDFRLNDTETALLRKNGFVVSEHLGGHSFAEVFYRLYSAHIPVFITADALLHAWHSSYDKMLLELEESYLYPTFDALLKAMAAALTAAQEEYGAGILAESLLDADYFLTVARSLLAERPLPTVFGQETRVEQTLAACAAQQMQKFKLFGKVREMDFSQFKPRGHYTRSPLLQRYFRAMIWCGRIDLRVAGNPKESSPRELGAALVLYDLLQRSGEFGLWEQFDRLIRTFVSRTDSMTFAQLGDLLTETPIRSAADVADWEALRYVQAAIADSPYGVQQICGDITLYDKDADIPPELPHSLTVLGQKFAVDSWALSKLVAPEVRWESWHERYVARRVPSCLDVAFAAFGNDAVVPELVRRVEDSDGRAFRDGLPYQHNLAAAREVIDSRSSDVWTESLYTEWLACLRTLSHPMTVASYPEAMRTRAWAMRTVNTQLASWAQLRHDTLLYVKPSFTMVPLCLYPAGYVEPHLPFWEQLERMATQGADLIEQTPFSDREPAYPEVHAERTNRTRRQERLMHPPDIKARLERLVRPRDIKARQVAFLRHFGQQVGRLKGIAQQQSMQQPLAEEDLQFLQETIEYSRIGSGSAGFTGWYPSLFYGDKQTCDKNDALVADVHTDPPSVLEGDPGCILHQGVGNVDLMVIAVDNGADRMVFAGPTLSHYEFEGAGSQRYSDEEWSDLLATPACPSRPAWTQYYLVPSDRNASDLDVAPDAFKRVGHPLERSARIDENG